MHSRQYRGIAATHFGRHPANAGQSRFPTIRCDGRQSFNVSEKQMRKNVPDDASPQIHLSIRRQKRALRGAVTLFTPAKRC
jgi:hypothetical protein